MKLLGTGILEGISTRQDGTMKFVIGTNEIDSDDAGRLFTLRNKYIKYFLSDNNISPAEEQIVNEEKLQDGKKIKSKCQRLRAVLFVMHEQQGMPVPFEDFYNNEMERIIEHYKTKLEPA